MSKEELPTKKQGVILYKYGINSVGQQCGVTPTDCVDRRLPR